MATRYPSERRTVHFIPVEDGVDVEMTQLVFEGNSAAHKVIGYQPAPIGPRQSAASYKPHGWLVVLVTTSATHVARPRRARKIRSVDVPRTRQGRAAPRAG